MAYEFDVQDGGGQVEEDGQQQVEGQQQTQQVADPNTGKMIPVERFNQVYGKMKEYEKNAGSYKEFGDPQTLKGRLDKLAQWEKAVDEQRKQQSMTDGEKNEAQRKLRLQKELYDIMPNLKALERIEALEAKLSAQEGTVASTRAEAVLEKHSAKFADSLRSAKIDTKFQPKIEEYIVSQMSDDDRQRFISGDFAVADEIFQKELKEGLFSTMRGRALPTPPVRHNAGGTPPDGRGAKKPLTMKEAEDAAWSRINSGE